MVWEKLKGLEITGVEHLIPLRFLFIYTGQPLGKPEYILRKYKA